MREMKEKDLVIQRHREVRDKIPEIKAKGVTFRDTAEFSDWRDIVSKWLN